MKQTTLKMLALAMGATSLCSAGETTPVAEVPVADSFSFCKWLPSKFKLFNAEKDNAENPYIQEFNAKFRAQYQWGSVAPNGDNQDSRSSNNEFRRLRAGFDARVFEDYKVEMVWNIGGANSTFNEKTGVRGRTSSSLDSFSVSRKFNDVGVELGKFKPAYTGEYRTSSSKIKTIERSAIVNQLTAEKTWGIAVKDANKKSTVAWQTGLWLQGIDDTALWCTPEFSTDTNVLYGASLTIQAGENAKVYVDYMHSFANVDGSDVVEPDGVSYEGAGARDVLALTYEYNKDQFYFMGELIGGFGVFDGDEGAENVFGLVLMPTYKFNDHFEGVFRYQLSAGSNAAEIYKRYYTTNSTYSSTSDLMQALYFGVNYYVCPEKPDMMKVMAGIEYVNSHGTDSDGDKGYNGWQFSTALRVNF